MADLKKLPSRPEALPAAIQGLVDRGVAAPLKTTKPVAGGGEGQGLPRIPTASRAAGSGEAWCEQAPVRRCGSAYKRSRAADDCTKLEAAAVPRAVLRSHGRRHDLPKRPGVGVRQKGKVNLVKALKELEEDKSTPSAGKARQRGHGGGSI